MSEAILERVMSKVAVGDDVNCWEWLAGKDPDGYGRVLVDGKSEQAHRVVYRLLEGEIEDLLHHTCENPGCVSPYHLVDVTAAAHKSLHPHYNSLKTHCPEGHPYDEENTVVISGCRVCRICKNRIALEGYHRRKEAES